MTATPATATPVAAVVGGGPGGLMAAEVLSSNGFDAVVFEHMPSVARKFVLAGRGGLNLTHSEPLEQFLGRYNWSETPGSPSLEAAIRDYPPAALRAWSEGLGHETFIGTSGRVFPRELRANSLLNSWLKRLGGLGVEIRTRTRFLGWRDKSLLLQADEDVDGRGQYTFSADVTVLALGGASWHRVGSDGLWQQLLADQGVEVAPLTPSNCGFTRTWSKIFSEKFEGRPVKNVKVSVTSHGAQPQRQDATARGEFMIVDDGVEGGVVYAVGAALRAQLAGTGTCELVVDLLPDISLDSALERLRGRRDKETTSRALRRLLGLDPVKIGLINEVSLNADGRPVLPETPEELARLAKGLPLELSGMSGLERAISSVGGVRLSALDANYMLKAMPSVFCVGEMIDWDAPTGGYLLQATFSTAVAAANGATKWFRSEHS